MMYGKGITEHEGGLGEEIHLVSNRQGVGRAIGILRGKNLSDQLRMLLLQLIHIRLH